MSKSVYIEVGKKCYSMCITCNVNDVPRSKDYMTEEKLDIILSILSQLGYKKIRLTGYDPISCKFLSDIIPKYQKEPHNMSFKILTTLLRYDKSVEIVDNIMVSLSAVEEYYEDYFSVKHFNRFKENFTKLSQYRQDIVINCTISRALKKTNSIVKLVKFLNEFSHSIKSAQFFNAMGEGNTCITINQSEFEKYLEALIVPYSLEWNSSGAKQTKCLVSKETMYIKENGDIYPCCMAGGEIGQDLVDELKIGNIFDYKDTTTFLSETQLSTILNQPLTNLSNNICDHCTPKYLKLNAKLLSEDNL